MTRGVSWAAVLALATVGCDDVPRTIATARPVSTDPANKSASQITPEKAPDKSDPKAVEVVAAAVAAHTGGKPALLQQFKTVQYVREGKIRPGGSAPTDQKWEVHAAWPDRFRIRAEMPGPSTGIAAWTDHGGWRKGGAIDKTPMTPAEFKDMQLESTGEWLLFLFPLTEPGAVLAPVAEVKVGDRPADGVRVWHPRLSDAIAYFDRETKLLVRLTYDGREGGRKVNKDVRVLGLKEFAGVKLPERTAYKIDGVEIAEWTTTAVEPKAQLDSKLFEEP
ncbi:MAG TPA: hypothetical protein VFG68_05540 [Fimbriiglobus sp.]|nr:hypothetical protein [Fimbriiglobus sp.]